MQADYFSNNILNQGLIILFSEKKNLEAVENLLCKLFF